MKTYQLVETVYKEYFVAANSLDEAIGKIEEGKVQPVETWTDDRIEVADVHDGQDWTVEKVSA
jgi:hypothetical protein